MSCEYISHLFEQFFHFSRLYYTFSPIANAQFVLRVWKRGWELISHHNLPHWMKDNEYLKAGYRPELRSAAACFKSIFRVHTETGNIWTHLLGALQNLDSQKYGTFDVSTSELIQRVYESIGQSPSQSFFLHCKG